MSESRHILQYPINLHKSSRFFTSLPISRLEEMAKIQADYAALQNDFKKRCEEVCTQVMWRKYDLRNYGYGAVVTA